MKDYQKRVMQECEELNGRIGKLNAFISDCNKFNVLPEDERVRLTLQESAMREYYRILQERIKAFDEVKQ